MTRDAVGCSFIVPLDAFARTDTIEHCIEVISSDTWCRPLRYLLLQVIPGSSFPHRRGTLRLGERDSVIRQMLVHPDVHEVILQTTGANTRKLDQYAWFDVTTRSALPPPYAAPHLASHAMQWTNASTRARDDRWVAAMLRYAERLCVLHGVVTVMEETPTLSDITLTRFTLDDVEQHPYPDQRERMRSAASDLGTRYVRFPRWGTIYSREHIDQLGGVDRIRDVVKPALIRDFGREAIYIQLTETVGTATSTEAMEKQHAFSELAAPLLPPLLS
jgi:hypothetical protein